MQRQEAGESMGNVGNLVQSCMNPRAYTVQTPSDNKGERSDMASVRPHGLDTANICFGWLASPLH